MTAAPQTRNGSYKERVREIERRRRAMAQFRLAAALCSYAARQLGNGLNTAQAREAAREATGELALLVDELRRLTRPRGVEERREIARQRAREGVPTRQICAELGVTDRSVRYYVAGRDYRKGAS